MERGRARAVSHDRRNFTMNVFTNFWPRAKSLWQNRHEPEHLRVLADAYWNTLLLVTALIVIGAALYGGLKLYILMRPSENNIVLSRGGGAVLNRQDLQATLDGFAKRKEQYDFLKKNRPPIADPSR